MLTESPLFAHGSTTSAITFVAELFRIGVIAANFEANIERLASPSSSEIKIKNLEKFQAFMPEKKGVMLLLRRFHLFPSIIAIESAAILPKIL